MQTLMDVLAADPFLPVLVFGALALVFGAALGYAAVRLRVARDPVVEQIDAVLPQTQCGQCGYPGCRPYAEAVAAGEAINRCPPGGDQTVQTLADLLGREAEPLDAEAPEPRVAFIHEADCIGCAKCLPACPVDAIVGAPQRMHTVIAAACTGCDLCVDPCPVDCIEMIPVASTLASWRWTPPGGALIATDREAA